MLERRALVALYRPPVVFDDVDSAAHVERTVLRHKVEDIVKITLLIRDHDDEKLQYLVRKRREVFGDNPPASTLIPVTALALESLEFEVDAVAVVR